MFEYIKGILVETSPLKVTVDIGGLGYSLLIPLSHYSQLPPRGEMVTLYTSIVIREDSHKIFGFVSRHERDLFESLIEISGIGPKTALALIGHMDISDLRSAVRQGNSFLICKIPGIGKKTAERLIIEMRDKIDKFSSHPQNHEEQGVVGDAISALIHLGYSLGQAQKAIKAALSKTKDEPELSALITSALRHIA